MSRRNGVSRRVAYFFYVLLLLVFVVAGKVTAGTEVGSFTAPLKQSWGGTGQDTSAATDGQILIGATSDHTIKLGTISAGAGISVTNGTNTIQITNTAGATAHNLLSTTHSDTLAGTVVRGDVIVGNSTPAWARVAVGGANTVLHSDGTDTSWQTLVAADIPNLNASKITAGSFAEARGGTNQTTYARGDILVASAANTLSKVTVGSSGKVLHSDGTDATWQSIANTDLPNKTVTAKTGNYTVLAADSGTLFTNTGAAGTVVFTLPTAAAGLHYYFYVDAVQTVQATAAASTTIQVGGSVSTSAGNISNNVKGTLIHIVAIDSTHWITLNALGSWTTA